MMLVLSSFLSTFRPGLGRVEKEITALQPGRIQYQSTYWPAELDESLTDITLAPNDWVEVVSRRGIVLIVRPYQP
jgi:membrane protein implicated in regulation of membrane protease activity